MMPSKIVADIIRGESNVDEHTEVVMTYPNGVESAFQVSLHKALQNEFEVIGTEATITVQEPFWGLHSEEKWGFPRFRFRGCQL